MGNRLGLGKANVITPSPRSEEQLLRPVKLSAEDLLAYEEAIRNGKDVQIFDRDLHLRTNRAINAMATGIQEPLTFSLDLIREMTTCLLRTDENVAEIILQGKNDHIWKNKQLSSLIDNYFKISLHTLDFFNSVEKYLSNLRARQTLLTSSLERLMIIYSTPGTNQYQKAMENLEKYKSIQTHITQEVLELFRSLYSDHSQMYQSLEKQIEKLDKKLGKVKSWRKTSNIIFNAALYTLTIVSIITATLAAPPTLIAILPVVSTTLSWAPTHRWFKRLWQGYENKVEEQKLVVNSMLEETYFASRDLEKIMSLVESLEMESTNFACEMRQSLSVEETQNGSLVNNGSGFVEETMKVRLAIKKIEIKVRAFSKNTDKLRKYVNGCTRKIQRARLVVLQGIMKTPSIEETSSSSERS